MTFNTTLEQAISTLERAEVTHVCSSGMAASHLALLTASAGRDELILCSSDVYGSVYTMVENIFPHLGARSILMDFTDLDHLEDVIKREGPRIVYFEVVTNPLTKVIDAPAVIEIAQRHGATVVVDNTFTTPYLLRLRKMNVQLVVDEWANTLEDIRAFVEAQAADMIQIKMPDLGGVHNTVEAVLVCKTGGVGAFLGGSCAETDLSARVAVHIALATRPDLIMAKPGMGVDEGIMLVQNEMARTLAWIQVRGA